MTTLRRLTCGLLVMSAAIAGCTVTRSAGSTPAHTSTNTSTDAGSVDLLPPRTRELDLTDADPCADFLTDKQLRELGYDLGYARPPLPDQSATHGGPNCTFSSSDLAGGDPAVSRNMLTLVGISTTEGAETWLTPPERVVQNRTKAATVAGVGALVMPNPWLRDSCLVVVDTANGQYLEVSTSPLSGKGSGSAPYCKEAERVAGMAIETVSATR